jgi:hypothetical protein
MVHRFDSADDQSDCLERAIENFSGNAEILEVAMNRRLEASQACPDSDDLGRQLPATSRHVVAPADIQVAGEGAHDVQVLMVRSYRHSAAVTVAADATAAFANHRLGAMTTGA